MQEKVLLRQDSLNINLVVELIVPKVDCLHSFTGSQHPQPRKFSQVPSSFKVTSLTDPFAISNVYLNFVPFVHLSHNVQQSNEMKDKFQIVCNNSIQRGGKTLGEDGFHHPTYTFYLHFFSACTMTFVLSNVLQYFIDLIFASKYFIELHLQLMQIA